MKNATMRLLKEMMLDDRCLEYIQNGWNILFNDIVELTGTSNLNQLDDISRFALLDWYEYKENKCLK